MAAAGGAAAGGAAVAAAAEVALLLLPRPSQVLRRLWRTERRLGGPDVVGQICNQKRYTKFSLKTVTLTT